MGKRKARADPDYSIECPVCGSKEIRYLRRSNSVYCRRCGAEWAADWVDPPKRKGVK